MCGIFAVLSSQPCYQPLIKGLDSLRYRGYDSCGMTLGADLITHKSLSAPQNLLANLSGQDKEATIGIAHTRWATHGAVSLTNAHPHISARLSVVHNGIIANHAELREILKSKGYIFHSETDTEVVVHLMTDLLKENTPIQALEALQEQLEGRYAIVVMCKDQMALYAISQDMPLVIGKDKHGMYVSSDLYALPPNSEFSIIPEKTACEVTRNATTPSLTYSPLPHLASARSCDGESFTSEEIAEQTEVLNRIESYWQASNPAKAIPIAPKHIIVIGCGSSYHSGLLLKHWLHTFPVFCEVYIASEIKQAVPYHDKNTLVIAISQSGETADTLLALKQFKSNQVIALCNMPHSTLSRLAHTTIDVCAGKETGVASTKAFSAQVTTLYLLYQHITSQTPQPLSPIKDAIQSVLDQQARIFSLAETIQDFKNILCIGQGSLHAIALEASLKIKELSYIHAEGLPSGELKHGPLALIDPNMLVIGLRTGPCITMQHSLNEVSARKGPTLDLLALIDIPNLSHPLACLAVNVVTQILAVRLANLKGLNIDQPRNLAKCVTVE